MTFPVHTISTAAPAAQETLTGAEKAFGFVPNLLGTMAEAPALLKGYLALSRLFDESSLTPTERQLVLLTVSYENGCAYCMAAHTVIAGMQKVPATVLEALRAGQPLTDARLEALRQFTTAVVASRGWPGEGALATFTAAGYGAQQVLEVVLGVGIKTMSNYTNHLAGTPLDTAFGGAAWERVA
ncbi:MAG: carboxymuconolactone decarboxylase family protein [Vicinamibacterales bacterium]